MIRYFQAKPQTSSLLFQFIYSECLMSYAELKPFLTNQPNQTLEKTTPLLIQLTGSASTPFHFFSWGHQEGLLTKLKQNCAHFAQLSNLENRQILHFHANRAWSICLECYHPYTDISKHLLLAFQQIQDLANELKTMISEFKLDENVLLFLLQHKSQIESMYHTHFIKEKVESLFPEGIQSALKFLTQSYEKRGFSHLLPIICKYIEEL